MKLTINNIKLRVSFYKTVYCIAKGIRFFFLTSVQYIRMIKYYVKCYSYVTVLIYRCKCTHFMYNSSVIVYQLRLITREYVYHLNNFIDPSVHLIIISRHTWQTSSLIGRPDWLKGLGGDKSALSCDPVSAEMTSTQYVKLPETNGQQRSTLSKRLRVVPRGGLYA